MIWSYSNNLSHYWMTQLDSIPILLCYCLQSFMMFWKCILMRHKSKIPSLRFMLWTASYRWQSVSIIDHLILFQNDFKNDTINVLTNLWLLVTTFTLLAQQLITHKTSLADFLYDPWLIPKFGQVYPDERHALAKLLDSNGPKKKTTMCTYTLPPPAVWAIDEQ